MAETRALDVYDAAYLAGGPDRAVDTAVGALVETGRVRVQGSGALCVVEAKPRHEIEAAVLDAIGSGGWRQIDTVRWRAGRDERLTALAERLQRDGLLAGNGLARALYRLLRPLMDGPILRLGPSLALSGAGRRVLRNLRADPALRGAAPGTSAARVALGGPAQMPDVELRRAVFQQPRPTRGHHSGGGPHGRYDGRYATRGVAGYHSIYGTCGGDGYGGSIGGHGGSCGGGGCGGGGCGGGG